MCFIPPKVIRTSLTSFEISAIAAASEARYEDMARKAEAMHKRVVREGTYRVLKKYPLANIEKKEGVDGPSVAVVVDHEIDSELLSKFHYSESDAWKDAYGRLMNNMPGPKRYKSPSPKM